MSEQPTPTPEKAAARLLDGVPLIRCRIKRPFGPEASCACPQNVDGPDCSMDRPFTISPAEPSEQPTPADLTAILAKHAPTFTEMAHDPTTTFYCKSCSEAAGDWVTWTPEHLAEQITAAGFGHLRTAVENYAAGALTLRQMSEAHLIARAEQAEAREKALRERAVTVASDLIDPRYQRPGMQRRRQWADRLLATSPDREDGAS